MERSRRSKGSGGGVGSGGGGSSVHTGYCLKKPGNYQKVSIEVKFMYTCIRIVVIKYNDLLAK